VRVCRGERRNPPFQVGVVAGAALAANGIKASVIFDSSTPKSVLLIRARRVSHRAPS
jgi:hypothetical protein